MLVPAFLLVLAPAPTATAAPESATPARVEVEPDAVPIVPEAAAPLPESSAPFVGPPPVLPPPTSSNAARMLEARPELQRPAFSGEALSFVAAGLTSLGLLVKINGTMFAVSAAKNADRPSETSGGSLFGFNSNGMVSNIIAASSLSSAVPLLGSGMGMYGRWAAHGEVAAGRARDRLDIGLMIGLGCTAVGFGVASLVITSFADDSAQTHVKATAIREAGYWTGAVGILGGTSLAGYGVGYRIALGRLERRQQVRIAPLSSPQLMGLRIAGSF